MLRLRPVRARAARRSRGRARASVARRDIGPSLSVSYRRPLHIVRGVMQYLVDADGRRYLDAVNNVAHVGHAHPRRGAGRRPADGGPQHQYPLPARAPRERYAERLTATLPRTASTSASSSVPAARRTNWRCDWRGRYTAERDLVVLEAGYHGNTSTLVDVSPYKFDGPGGAGAPPWVQKVPMPDTYRGPFRRDDEARRRPSTRRRYATPWDASGAPAGAPPAFLAESVLSCGGQVVLPPGYLAEAYRHVRAAGGVCIADEVQVGLGRAGSHLWAFETQGVVPDIVTMGKPIGNGHPLGAVVTTPEIAASFANGMEYFNTFGGNPVSCAIGLAVLDVIRGEGLQAERRG